MRLTELEPRLMRREVRNVLCVFRKETSPGVFTDIEEMADREYLISVDSITDADCIQFLCPKCFVDNSGPVGTHMCMVYFAGRNIPDTVGLNSEGKAVRWSASGASFDDLTLSPSILLIGGCAWHGFVTNGDVTSA